MAERSDMPTGMPDDPTEEPAPLGAEDHDPDGEGDTPRGEKAQPGIPDEGEPPTAG